MRLGTLHRAFNVFTMILYAKLTKKRIPVRVAFQLTKKCNMRCSYCYANFDTYEKVPELTKEQIFSVIDDLYSNGTRWLWFLGGEPMARQDFFEIIEYAQKKGIFCDMNSNGTMINENNINTVKKLDAVCISVDGSEESNDFYRGKGNYRKAIETVKYLKKNGINVRLHSILTQKTYNTLKEMSAAAAELGVSFNYCEVLKKEKEGSHVLTEEQSSAFYNEYLSLKKSRSPIIHSIDTIKRMMAWPKKNDTLIYASEKNKYEKGSYVPCVSGDLQCFFDLDGRIYACNGTWENGLNYFETGFKKAWDYLENRDCCSCRCIGMVELHTLLSLYPETFINGIKNILRHV